MESIWYNRTMVRMLGNLALMALLFVAISVRGENVSPEAALRAYYHAANLLKEFPPDKFYVVGFGSNTPLIEAALRDLLGSQALTDRYLMEFPIERFNEKAVFEDYAPGGKRDALIKKMFPAGPGTAGRQPVVLRNLMVGATIDDFARAVKAARANLEPGAVPPKIHGYLIHNAQIADDLDPKKLEAGMGGRVFVENDRVITKATTLRGGSRNDPEDPSRFTRFAPFKPTEFLEGAWALRDNPGWEKIQTAVAAHGRLEGKLTLPANVPLSHVEGAKQILTDLAKDQPPLHRQFNGVAWGAACQGEYRQLK